MDTIHVDMVVTKNVLGVNMIVVDHMEIVSQ